MQVLFSTFDGRTAGEVCDCFIQSVEINNGASK